MKNTHLNKKLTNLIDNAYNIVYKLMSIGFKELDFVKFLPIFFKDFRKSVKCNGLAHTVKQYKTMRLHVTRFLCGYPLKVNLEGVGVTKDG